jgi:DNA-binding SARP family transcriptional activator
VEDSVGAGVETAVDSQLRVQMLGPLRVFLGDQVVPLAASRKVRALFCYLALAPRPVGRSQLCELLWDVPNDPRGELRWCLSKIRAAIERGGRKRVVTNGDEISLDLSDCVVDAMQVDRATRDGLERQTVEHKCDLVALFAGDFLESLEIDRSPAFNGWLTAQRRRFRACHAALLEQIALKSSDDDAQPYLEKWLQLAPFDRRVHELLLRGFARRGRMREGEEHLAATTAMFEAEGLDASPIRDAWRAGRAQSIVVPAPRVIEEPLPSAQRRASIAVMPFADQSSSPGERGSVADALAHDITTRLAKLRSMFVIAQGSAFALHERRVGPEEAGRMLNVDYVLSGSVRLQGSRLTVTVDLVETRTARIVWSEILNQKLDDTFAVLEEIGNKIVASIAAEIETIERNRAVLRPPSSLDAWEAHHRGLWHMYRFTKADNERAKHFFETAVKLDPTFARAYAGLSFTHFQNAFLGWGKRGAEIDRAYATAGQSILVDDRDPAAHWAMGRALWLRGDNEHAVAELQHSVQLSPNFALAHYTLAFVQAQAGDPEAAIAASDCSRALSPFDPLLFAMLGSRAMALARQGRHAEAAQWAAKAAARPNAHAHIHAIAAFTSSLAGELDDARSYAATIRKMVPSYAMQDFLDAFRFEEDGEKLFREAAKRIGL